MCWLGSASGSGGAKQLDSRLGVQQVSLSLLASPTLPRRHRVLLLLVVPVFYCRAEAPACSVKSSFLSLPRFAFLCLPCSKFKTFPISWLQAAAHRFLELCSEGSSYTWTPDLHFEMLPLSPRALSFPGCFCPHHRAPLVFLELCNFSSHFTWIVGWDQWGGHEVLLSHSLQV